MSLDENGNVLNGHVEDVEQLFRGVPNQPSFIKEDGSITSAILKDSHGGVSVDRDGEMPVSIVRQNKCDVTAVPLDNNPYHAEITQNGSGELKRGDIKNILKQSFVLDNPV